MQTQLLGVANHNRLVSLNSSDGDTAQLFG